MRTLYITDLDETLLDTDSNVSEYSANIINKIIEKGNFFSYATSRGTAPACRLTSSLNINIPVVLHNGVFVTNPTTKEVLISNSFKTEEILFLKDLFSKYNITPNSYSIINGAEKIAIIPDYSNPGKKYFLDSRENDKRLRFIDNIEELYNSDSIYSFLCIGSKDELKPIHETIQKHPNINSILQQETRREEFWCDIAPSEATKAKSILKLKEMLNCDKIISFGNGLNDISMFKISDECYAVSNAEQELKDISTGVIESNNEDGVAKWLKKHVLDSSYI